MVTKKSPKKCNKKENGMIYLSGNLQKKESIFKDDDVKRNEIPTDHYSHKLSGHDMM